ncbi:unnamed protein product [Prorocentrum cordatum]|uniref:Uncharacterized protein n=1 Tax=Prorocentrum cordatum TaxID=2364126 RepID=A0ABN9YEP0_9DINO|nr:unnamed protein product [Polarella glacialis]
MRCNLCKNQPTPAAGNAPLTTHPSEKITSPSEPRIIQQLLWYNATLKPIDLCRETLRHHQELPVSVAVLLRVARDGGHGLTEGIHPAAAAAKLSPLVPRPCAFLLQER